MPGRIDKPSAEDREKYHSRANTTTGPRVNTSFPSWFALPASLKYLFSSFPLLTLPTSQLPIRTAPHRDQHTLYIFTSLLTSSRNGPSFNPACLKWQTYLKFLGVKFRTVASANHASPTGALPFLIPASGGFKADTGDHGHKGAVPSNKLQKWAREKGVGREEPGSIRYEAYMTLLDHWIRRAWLYTLYLSQENFTNLVQPLYIHTASCSAPVRIALARSLQAAALAEILASSLTVSPNALYADAEAAFAALSTLLGDNEWFFGVDRPGLFDAGVFAYTYLLLGGMEWTENRLEMMVEGFSNLVEHKDRIVERYYGDNEEM